MKFVNGSVLRICEGYLEEISEGFLKQPLKKFIMKSLDKFRKYITYITFEADSLG